MNNIVMAVDPGVTTGVAVMNFTKENVEVVFTEQLSDPDNVWKEIYHIAEEWKSEAEKTQAEFTLLCESFEARPDVFDPDETPKYIIKDLDRYVAPEFPIRYQLASYAKVGVHPTKNGRPDRLRKFGFYQTGKRHANDAIRHAVTFAIDQLRHGPTIMKGWGKPNG